MSDTSAQPSETVAMLDRDESVEEIASSPPSPAAPSPSTRGQTARRLLWLVRPFRGTVAMLFALSLVAVAIDVVPPMLQGVLVDKVLRVDPAVGGTNQLMLLLAGIVGSLLVIRVAAMIVSIFKGKISSRVGTMLTAYLRNVLVERLSFLPLSFHNRNQVGALMSRVAYDTETMHTLVYHITGGLLLQAMQLVGIGVMLFYYNPKLAVATLLPMPFIVAGSWYFTRYLQPRYNHYWDAVGKQAGGLTGMLTGIRVVKTFAQEEREIERFGRASKHLCESRQTVDGSIATFSSVMGFVFALGGLAVWYIGGRDVLFGHMTLGALMAFLAYLAMFYAPLTSISESTSWFSSFFATIDRIFDLLETPIEECRVGQDCAAIAGPPSGNVESRNGGPALADSLVPPYAPSRGGVEFQHVSFAYDKTKPVLKDISFAVQPGEMIGIVGRSGSGKSTLVSLIARLYEVDAGRVFVGGADAKTQEPRKLRRRIGMVQQEPFLFRGTIWENITYGNTTAEAEEILIAARQADAHGFVMRQPFAYESHLGEGGKGLSGGERQRLSIARALLVDPDILILDEATASIDAESERAICAAIRRFSRRRTTIAIAHRLSTLRNADRLLVFDQGRLLEQGTHDELMTLDGLYSSLVRLQYSSGPIEESEDEVADMPWLDPTATEIAADDGGKLIVNVSGTLRVPNASGTRSVPDTLAHHCVVAAAAFPATAPDEFISLRRQEPDGRETEIGIIRSLEHWPAAVRAAVRTSVQARQELRRIDEVRHVRSSGNFLEMTLVTSAGVENIRMDKSGEGLQRYGRRGILLLDTADRYYVIPDRNDLPKAQQKLLSLYFGEQI